MKSKLIQLFKFKGVNKYFFNTFWMFIEKISLFIAGFFVGIWVARYLGPSDFGALKISQSIVIIFSGFSTLGIKSILIKKLVEQDFKDKYLLLGTAFWLKFAGSLFMFSLFSIILTSYGLDIKIKNIILIITISYVFQSFFVVDFYYQAKVLNKYVALSRVLGIISVAIIKIILITINAPLINFAIVIVLENIIFIGSLLIIYKFLDGQKLSKWRFSKKVASDILRESYPLAISFFMVSISLHINQIILKGNLDDVSLGLYAASQRIIEIWYFIPIALSSSFFPAIIRVENKITYDLRIKALGTAITFISIFISLPLLIWRKEIIMLLFGENYLLSSEILFFHAISIIFVFNSLYRNKILVAEGEVKLIRNYSLVTAILMLASSVILVKHYGGVGASMAYLITWGANVLIFPIFYNRIQIDMRLFLQTFNPLNIYYFYESYAKKNIN